MSVKLAKGGNVSLAKQAPNLTAVAVGLGWHARATAGADFDLDASAFATGPNKKVLSDSHFVFYNNPYSPERTIEHTGDDLVGGSGGDDEVINVDLANTPPAITNIFFSVSIHDADNRRQNFGQVTNAYIRVVDQATTLELARFDLTEDASTETAMIFGELYRHTGEWKFRAIGQGYASGLRGIAVDYGVNVE
ncbi:chemical-damaging agent resistance protein C [Mycobacterium asiaticum]|uniref:Chemical-damaging agent resistance protein C n=1 Tax=Mycobacterium asiaticum TaxID=1790 RepID=A0A1A3P4E8_MYCAS|nr:TerD family protein [Mycobacterium asiaticum]OBK27467.1 chemical-damaging agent resistance protein C [Mycobacterium asiaticum]